jgi:hypothetical protein
LGVLTDVTDSNEKEKERREKNSQREVTTYTFLLFPLPAYSPPMICVSSRPPSKERKENEKHLISFLLFSKKRQEK